MSLWSLCIEYFSVVECEKYNINGCFILLCLIIINVTAQAYSTNKEETLRTLYSKLLQCFLNHLLVLVFLLTEEEMGRYIFLLYPLHGLVQIFSCLVNTPWAIKYHGYYSNIYIKRHDSSKPLVFSPFFTTHHKGVLTV